MDSESSRYLIVLVICLCFSAFFSSAETALTSLSKIRLRTMVDDKVKNAKLIQKVLDNPNKLLSAILIGNNLVNNLAASLATILATKFFGSSGVGIATGVLTVLVLIFGEITPKTYARNNCEKISVFCIKVIYFCTIIFTPIIAILNVITGSIVKLLGGNSDDKHSVTEVEFRTMVDVSHEEGVLESTEKEMITNVVDFGDSDAEDVMVPRMDMVSIPEDMSYQEVMQVFRKERFTRLPVYADTNDHIVGVLSFKDVMFVEDTANFKVADYMKEPYFTYESKPCSKLFNIMKRDKLSMAIVLDEYGGTAGIVTLQDLIVEIVGDIIEDDRDDEEEIIKFRDNEYIVNGSAKLDDVNEVLGTDFEFEDVESIGGYVIALVDRFPKKGEQISDKTADFTILLSEKNRIEKMRIVLKKQSEDIDEVKEN